MKQGVEAYLLGKCPGLTTDVMVEKLYQLAKQTAGMAGGLSGAAASGAAFTARAAIPATISAIKLEILFKVRL